MKFKMNESGDMILVKQNNIKEEVNLYLAESAHIIDVPKLKTYVKEMKFLEGKTLSVTPILLLATVTAHTAGAGVFWDTFMKWIFPWLLDISKVFCTIKIAQGFYNEHRGGKDGGSGVASLVTYGKWLVLFHMIPWGVTLVDQIGATMFNDLQK